jgi:single-stranded DNA-binding protein
MIHIHDVFTVSSNRNRKVEPIRDIVRSDGTRMVAVDFYTYQTYRSSNPDAQDKDKIPAFNCTATFFDRQAELALTSLMPGRSVLLSGYLVQTITERDGVRYVNNDIRNARFEFLPLDRSGEETTDNTAPFETTEQYEAQEEPAPAPTQRVAPRRPTTAPTTQAAPPKFAPRPAPAGFVPSAPTGLVTPPSSRRG